MISATTMLKWDDGKVLQAVDQATRTATMEGATAVLERMQQKAPKREGDLVDSLGMRESEFKDGGYIVGVFGEAMAEWKDSLGARAVFNEYGHAARGQGRGNVKRSDVQKAIPAKPFMRPSLDASAGQIRSSFHNKLK